MKVHSLSPELHSSDSFFFLLSLPQICVLFNLMGFILSNKLNIQQCLHYVSFLSDIKGRSQITIDE